MFQQNKKYKYLYNNALNHKITIELFIIEFVYNTLNI